MLGAAVVLVGLVQLVRGEDGDWPCSSEIFCRPDQGILHQVSQPAWQRYNTCFPQVQMANIFPDSKTFVDMPLKFSEEQVLENFNKLPDTSKVCKHFDRLEIPL